MNFLIRWLTTAVAAGVAIAIIPGIVVSGGTSWGAIAVFGLVISLIDISIKPVFQLLSTPINILTLGISYLIINTLMLYIAVWAANSIFGAGIIISGFWSAFFAAIIISIVSALINSLVSE